MLCKFKDFLSLRSGHPRKPLKELFHRGAIFKILEQGTNGNPGPAENIFSALDFRAFLDRKAILPAHEGILALVFWVSTDQKDAVSNLQQCSKARSTMRSEVVGSSGHADRVKKENTAKNIYPSR